MKRVIFDVIFLLCVFISPWWITVILAFSGIFIFAHFYEFIGAAVIMYALYAIEGSNFLSSPFWFCITISVLYISIQALRRYIILYKS